MSAVSTNQPKPIPGKSNQDSKDKNKSVRVLLDDSSIVSPKKEPNPKHHNKGAGAKSKQSNPKALIAEFATTSGFGKNLPMGGGANLVPGPSQFIHGTIHNRPTVAKKSNSQIQKQNLSNTKQMATSQSNTQLNTRGNNNLHKESSNISNTVGAFKETSKSKKDKISVQSTPSINLNVESKSKF